MKSFVCNPSSKIMSGIGSPKGDDNFNPTTTMRDQELNLNQLNATSKFDLQSDIQNKSHFEQYYNASIGHQGEDDDDEAPPMQPFDQ